MLLVLFIYLFAFGITLIWLGGLVFKLHRSYVSYKAAAARAKIPVTPSTFIQPLLKHPLRILMFGWEFPPFNSGGLGVACEGITRGLSQNGAEVTLVLPRHLPLSLAQAKVVYAGIENVSVRIIQSSLTPYNTSTQARLLDGTLVYGDGLLEEVRRYADAASRIAAQEPHDVVYAHDWLSLGAGVAAKRKSKKPLVSHIHATELDRTGGSGVNQAIYDLERNGMHESDRVIAVSQLTKNVITNRYGIPSWKVHVVHNGIDAQTARPDPLKNRLQTLKKSGYKIVLFMGRITLQKGPDYFIRAAQKVLEKDPHTIFVMAGSGDMQRQMIELAASLGIGDKVFFPGFLRGDAQAEMCAAADVFVMPSVSEPFGLVALEAMRAGVPIIVSKQSGVAEIAPHALTVDFWDIDRMASLIHNVLTSPELQKELSHKGRATASETTWNRAAFQIHSILNDTAQGAPQFA